MGVGDWIGIGVIVIIIAWVVSMYNGLVNLRNQVKNAWRQIDVQLKRRHELIPNLVETAKGYMKHERETFETITKARSQAMGANNVADASKAEGALGDALSKFLLVVENYPDLKANQNFLQMQEELAGTENKIAYVRQHYNDVVMEFNVRIQVFPNNLLAGSMGFKNKELFSTPEEEKKVPKVKF